MPSQNQGYLDLLAGSGNVVGYDAGGAPMFANGQQDPLASYGSGPEHVFYRFPINFSGAEGGPGAGTGGPEGGGILLPIYDGGGDGDGGVGDSTGAAPDGTGSVGIGIGPASGSDGTGGLGGFIDALNFMFTPTVAKLGMKAVGFKPGRMFGYQNPEAVASAGGNSDDGSATNASADGTSGNATGPGGTSSTAGTGNSTGANGGVAVGPDADAQQNNEQGTTGIGIGDGAATGPGSGPGGTSGTAAEAAAASDAAAAATAAAAGVGPGATGESGTASSGGDGGGGGGGDGGSVICTELHRRGVLDDATYRADSDFGRRLPALVVAGYQAWARPLVRVMQREDMLGSVAFAVGSFFGRPWAKEMAFRMGVGQKGSWLGTAMLTLGYPVCGTLGAVLTVKSRFSAGRPAVRIA